MPTRRFTLFVLPSVYRRELFEYWLDDMQKKIVYKNSAYSEIRHGRWGFVARVVCTPRCTVFMSGLCRKQRTTKNIDERCTLPHSLYVKRVWYILFEIEIEAVVCEMCNTLAHVGLIKRAKEKRHRRITLSSMIHHIAALSWSMSVISTLNQVSESWLPQMSQFYCVKWCKMHIIHTADKN